MMDKNDKLSAEDQARVDEYLALPTHQVKRRPYSPWKLLLVLWAVVSVLGGISYYLAWVNDVL
jgi:hypothetical protein